LQDHPERVGLAGPRLPAKECVPVEATGVGQAWHTGDQRELAQPQLCGVPSAALQPRLHLRPGGDAGQRIVKRCPVAFQDRSLAVRVPDLDLCPGLWAARPWQRQLCNLLPAELQGENLAEAPGAVAL